MLLWLWLPNHSSHRPHTLGPLQEVPIWDSRPATAARAPLDGAQPAPPRGGPVERKIGARPPIATSSVPPMRPPAAVAAFLPRERMCAPDPRRHISRAAPCGADLHRIRCGRVCGATDEDLCRPGRADEPTKHPARSCHAAVASRVANQPSQRRETAGRSRAFASPRTRSPARGGVRAGAGADGPPR